MVRCCTARPVEQDPASLHRSLRLVAARLRHEARPRLRGEERDEALAAAMRAEAWAAELAACDPRVADPTTAPIDEPALSLIARQAGAERRGRRRSRAATAHCG